MKGVWLLLSVALTSAAQLLFRYGMVSLPDLTSTDFLTTLWADPLRAAPVFAGILAYGLSMLFWCLALRTIALSKAYPVLSLSYAIVWVLGMLLPGIAEVFHWGKLLGVMLILGGLAMIYWPTSRDPSA